MNLNIMDNQSGYGGSCGYGGYAAGNMCGYGGELRNTMTDNVDYRQHGGG